MLRPDLNGLRIRINESNEVYFVDEGKARHIADEKTYNATFKDWDNIWLITFTEKNMIDIGLEIKKDLSLSYWEGHYFMNDAPEGNDDNRSYRRHIADDNTMVRYHFQKRPYVHVTTTRQFEHLDPTRGAIKWNPVYNGDLFRTSKDDRIYLMDQWKKRHIQDTETLHSLFGEGDAIPVVDNLDEYANGLVLSSKTTRLIRVKNHTEIYLQDHDVKRLITDQNAMAYYRFARGRINEVAITDVEGVHDGEPIRWPDFGL
jgi:hypothetical protein